MVLAGRELRKVFGEGEAEVRAVDGVTLEFRAGEVALIQGPSGSGKTTLLTMLGLLMRPTEGRVELKGMGVQHLPERRRAALRLGAFGFVFQNFLLLPALSASENVELAANLAGVRGAAARDRADQLLTRLGLERRLRAPPSQLSGGEKQRVALARALVNEPPVLLADEPTANLDSASGRKVGQLFLDAARERACAVVIVSHDERLRPFVHAVHTMEDGHLTGSAGGGAERGPGPAGTRERGAR